MNSSFRIRRAWARFFGREEIPDLAGFIVILVGLCPSVWAM